MTTSEEATFQEAIRRAEKIGKRHGENAAEYVAQYAWGGRHTGDSEAGLIAAAPDLLEALRGFHPSQIKAPGELARAWEVAKAAIAKAEGRAE
jgi:hypothetical protein